MVDQAAPSQPPGNSTAGVPPSLADLNDPTTQLSVPGLSFNGTLSNSQPTAGGSQGMANSDGNIVTLEPYDGFTKINRKNRRRNRQRPHQILQDNLAAFRQAPCQNYKKYYTLTPATEDQGTMDEIRSKRDLETKIGGSPTKVTLLRNGKIIVEVANYEQSQKIMTINCLHRTNVKVEPHNTLNVIKGTIICVPQ